MEPMSDVTWITTDASRVGADHARFTVHQDGSVTITIKDASTTLTKGEWDFIRKVAHH